MMGNIRLQILFASYHLIEASLDAFWPAHLVVAKLRDRRDAPG